MTEKRCWLCRWAQWELSDKGRRLSTRPGYCRFPVQWPKLPECFGDRPQWPYASAIWPDSGKSCLCFEPLNPKRPKALSRQWADDMQTGKLL